MNQSSLYGKTIFVDRAQAGQELARALSSYRKNDAIILALPRGGVPIGYGVAKKLRMPLDVIVARKIGLPENKEYAIGAVAEDGVQILDEQMMGLDSISSNALKKLMRDEQSELKRRVDIYRPHRYLPVLHGKTVIIVDDGLATGFTARAAIETIKRYSPKRLVFAAPVCARDNSRQVESMVDDLICLVCPSDFQAVGLWYQEFDQVSDEEVLRLLLDIRYLSKTWPRKS